MSRGDPSGPSKYFALAGPVDLVPYKEDLLEVNKQHRYASKQVKFFTAIVNHKSKIVNLKS